MSYRYLQLERPQRQIAQVTIARPEQLNAIDRAVLDELSQLIDELEQERELLVVILTGAGEKAFVAGGDVAYMAAMSMAEARRFVYAGQEVLLRLERSSKVSIAAINGYALGGGLELALACDLRLAAEGAQLGLPETSLGLLPGWGGTQRLARLLGPGLAKELIFTGRRVGAEEALRLGLVNRVVPRERLLSEAQELAQHIARNSPIAVQQAKRAINQGLQTSLDQGLVIEAEAWLVLFATHDRQEGTRAFVEKRAPHFTGE
uniref:Short-chain-enoyl-CoA hydratase n=1 Tax=Thermogemmatispora argillosa TaxID=2045280 RepID=A0A455T0G3_9CHLR|nr:short-chain-enoyl-CoA hydratase [Thermogemmatispora argillosa]